MPKNPTSVPKNMGELEHTTYYLGKFRNASQDVLDTIKFNTDFQESIKTKIEGENFDVKKDILDAGVINIEGFGSIARDTNLDLMRILGILYPEYGTSKRPGIRKFRKKLILKLGDITPK